MLHRLLALLFPSKCILCRKLLTNKELDLCDHCRTNAPEILKENFRLSFIAQWTAVWYYKDDVRGSLLRYKFYGRRSYAKAYGRILAMKILQRFPNGFDILTFVPTSRLRRMRRGFDHMELVAKAVAAELEFPVSKVFTKVRNTPPQSGFSDASQRRANVMNVFRIKDRDLVRGKRILVLDDIITTGATISECAKTLLTSGAKEVYCAALAAASHDKKQVNKP